MTTSVRSVGNVDLTIGLVSVPVKMIGVIDNHDRKGSMYHAHGEGDFGKIKMPKVCDCGETVALNEISKGYEQDGDIVILTPSELETVATNTGPGVEVLHFVKADQVNAMLFADQNVYRLIPDVKRGRQAWTSYRAIRQSLIEKGLVGVLSYTRWGRNRLGLLIVEPTEDGGMLAIRNMAWPDELRHPEGLLPADGGDVDPRLAPVMESLVTSMTTDWSPESYVDTYTEQLSAAIEAKASGGEIEVLESGGDGSIDDVSELLAKLEKTVQEREIAKKSPVKKATPRKRASKKIA
jgi:DNA end-binding protein Ku